MCSSSTAAATWIRRADPVYPQSSAASSTNAGRKRLPPELEHVFAPMRSQERTLEDSQLLAHGALDQRQIGLGAARVHVARSS